MLLTFSSRIPVMALFPQSHPDQSGRSASTTDDAPWVEVRAGKTFLCTACGTVVQVPDDCVEQLGLVVRRPPQSTPAKPDSAEPKPDHRSTTNEKLPRETPPAEPTSTSYTGGKPAAGLHTSYRHAARNQPHGLTAPPLRPPPNQPPLDRPERCRLSRQQRPARRTFAGQRIDGLTVPTAAQLDRALSWVMAHLRTLERQTQEIKQLNKQLRKRRPPRRSAPEEVRAARGQEPDARPDKTGARPADTQHQRGPP